MNDFISAVRTDRQREMKQREERGIVISDKYKYRMVDTISVVMADGSQLTYGFQANHKDVYFFIVEEGANSYYSIIELYELLQKICDNGNEDIVLETLTKIKNAEIQGDFLYRGIAYHMKMADYPEYSGSIEMSDGARTMSYKQLFVLINLIQEKSNAFFTRGEVKNEDLMNGIVRLFICLLRGTQDYNTLKEKGWYYDHENRNYVFKKAAVEKNSKKYYLTEDEYLSIIKSES